MKAKYVNSVFMATKDIFQLMLNIEPQRKDLKIIEDTTCGGDANVLLGITGDLQGAILFGFPMDMALQMIKIMSGMEMDKIDSFASSALGEIGNIIGGNTLSDLSENNYMCDIVPPKVFIGQYKSASLAKYKPLVLSLTTPIGEFDVCIFLKT